MIMEKSVLLMLAEAINEQGGRQTEEEGYLNQVRTRTKPGILGVHPIIISSRA